MATLACLCCCCTPLCGSLPASLVEVIAPQHISLKLAFKYRAYFASYLFREQTFSLPILRLWCALVGRVLWLLSTVEGTPHTRSLAGLFVGNAAGLPGTSPLPLPSTAIMLLLVYY